MLCNAVHSYCKNVNGSITFPLSTRLFAGNSHARALRTGDLNAHLRSKLGIKVGQAPGLGLPIFTQHAPCFECDAKNGGE
jgi:hypothetical protein